MLAVFDDGTEILICEVDGEGLPRTKGYFKKSTGREKCEMDLILVEAPIMITRGSLCVDVDRRLS